MAALVAAPWLGFAVPVALAVLVAVVGRLSRPLAPVLAALAPLTVLAIGVGSLLGRTAGESAAAPWTSTLASAGGFTWFATGST